jgi:hypothetical protein
MLPLILAAAVATTAPAPPPPDCSPPQVKTAAPSPTQSVQKLADLPDALAIRAVLRSVGGCSYQDVMRFHVSTPGPYYPSGTLAPVEGGMVDRAVPTGHRRDR